MSQSGLESFFVLEIFCNHKGYSDHFEKFQEAGKSKRISLECLKYVVNQILLKYHLSFWEVSSSKHVSNDHKWTKSSLNYAAITKSCQNKTILIILRSFNKYGIFKGPQLVYNHFLFLKYTAIAKSCWNKAIAIVLRRFKKSTRLKGPQVGPSTWNGVLIHSTYTQLV
jgi:hypothetical protein